MLDEQTRMKDGVEELQRKGFRRSTNSMDKTPGVGKQNTGTADNDEPMPEQKEHDSEQQDQE